jgi:hypothetical protein
MTDNKNADWNRVLQELLAATDKDKIKSKADELESLLYDRGQTLRNDSEAETERQAVKEAAQTLLNIRVEKLGYPLDPSILGRAGGQRDSQE